MRRSGVTGSGFGQRSSPMPEVDRGGQAAEARMLVAVRRDPAAFAPLYHAYFPAVYRYCLRCIGDREAAADSTQEVFARVLAALPRTEVATFRPWLFTIAHHVIADRHRLSARRPVPAPLSEADDR